MKSLARLLLSALLCTACEAAPKAERTSAERPAAAPQPAVETVQASSPSAERRFGAEPRLAGAPIPVEAVLREPDPHLGKSIKCEGTVARVCQAAGCWLELQAAPGGEGLRVPMANHAFFIPQDAVGKLAVVEGELKRFALPPEQRDHYAAEGMKAVGPLSLEASSVVLR
jgi:hypothetical protein